MTIYCVIRGRILFLMKCHGVCRVRAMVESGLYVHWLKSEIPAITTCRLSPSSILVTEQLSLDNLWVTR